jgi:4-hydroxyphenylpyruvate dioxygenase
MKQDKIRIVLTTPLTQDLPIHDHLRKHGDGVKRQRYRRCNKCVRRNDETWCPFFMEPTVEKDEFGEVVRSGIYTYGETVHIFVERKIIRAFSYLVQGMETDYNRNQLD